MPTPTSFIYSVANDTANGKAALASLHDEILASDITVAVDLDNFRVDGDVLTVGFKDVVLQADVDPIVAAHLGVDPTGAGPKTASGAPIVQLTGPVEPDGKPLVLTTPARLGWNTFFTSRGDDNSIPGLPGRGEGSSFHLHFDANEVGTKTVDVQFAEPVEVHDGEVHWNPPNTGFGFDDFFTFRALIPATQVVANPGAGNVQAVPFYEFGNVLLPAAGNGSHDLALVDAVPIPAGVDENGEYGGYWDLTPDTGEVRVADVPGKGQWNLVDFDITVNLIKNVGLGNPRGVFDVNVYKTEYFHPMWSLRLEVTRNLENAPAADLGGWIMLFRKVST